MTPPFPGPASGASMRSVLLWYETARRARLIPAWVASYFGSGGSRPSGEPPTKRARPPAMRPRPEVRSAATAPCQAGPPLALVSCWCSWSRGRGSMLCGPRGRARSSLAWRARRCRANPLARYDARLPCKQRAEHTPNSATVTGRGSSTQMRRWCAGWIPGPPSPPIAAQDVATGRPDCRPSRRFPPAGMGSPAAHFLDRSARSPTR
jgi:hypothetical protein